MFQIRSEAKQLYLQFQSSTDLPNYLITDEGKLRQVLILNNHSKMLVLCA
jgi:two-component system sensor histidine kinase/response regulator